MGKLSGGCKDQGCIDSGLLPTQRHRLFPVPAMVQKTRERSQHHSCIGFTASGEFYIGYSTGSTKATTIRQCRRKGVVCEHRVFQRSEGISEIHRLQPPKASCRETGGSMLAITGATRLYCVSGFTDMRYGKYALANGWKAIIWRASKGSPPHHCLIWNVRIT